MGEREDGSTSDDMIRAARDSLEESKRPTPESDAVATDDAGGEGPSGAEATGAAAPAAAESDSGGVEPGSIESGFANGAGSLASRSSPEPPLAPPPGPSPPLSPDKPWYKKGWVRALGAIAVAAVLLVSRFGFFDETPKEEFLGGLEEQANAAGVSDESWNCVVDEMEAGGYLEGLNDLTSAELAQLENMEFTEGLASAPPAIQRAAEGYFHALTVGGCLSPRELEALATTPVLGAPGEPSSAGDDPALDRLWSDCEAGELVACDILYLAAPIGSDYEGLGASCGGRNEPLAVTDPYCVEIHNQVDLDAMQAGCTAGDFGSCDLLFYLSPIGSEYEEFGATCGGLDLVGEPGFCLLRYGLGNR